MDDSTSGSTPAAAGEDTDPGDDIESRDDDIDDGILAADDTGMLAGERMITVVELAEGDTDAGSV